MKNLKLIALFALALNLVTFSCNKDDDGGDDSSSSSENNITIDGTEFEIETAILEEWGINEDGSYDWDVTLFSDGVEIDAANSTITGTGAAIYLDLNTNSETGLVPGTYTFANERAEFTWVFAEAVTNFNFETENGESFNAVSGTVVITGSGNNQVIVANLEDENGNAITASYKGSLQMID
ncbi:hypothetical protein [Sediminibacter sp. Hel_I_10]|uniref:hypothetical protein n=1 Tax=Sediminibacter sp. Hel_I_10 TaxID=1392490 RepID=UPI00047D704A|nr:hypothetical protein [Sediminibacter sp. Hel_I_10]